VNELETRWNIQEQQAGTAQEDFTADRGELRWRFKNDFGKIGIPLKAPISNMQQRWRNIDGV
jgi:hypothetical protein